MSDFNVFDWKRNAPLSEVANVAISILYRLAEAADADYTYDCCDSSNTNAGPVGEAQKFVRLMQKAILEVNASGFCDSGEFERFVGYNS
jgi:hypothetical protein